MVLHQPSPRPSQHSTCAPSQLQGSLPGASPLPRAPTDVRCSMANTRTVPAPPRGWLHCATIRAEETHRSVHGLLPSCRSIQSWYSAVPVIVTPVGSRWQQVATRTSRVSEYYGGSTKPETGRTGCSHAGRWKLKAESLPLRTLDRARCQRQPQCQHHQRT